MSSSADLEMQKSISQAPAKSGMEPTKSALEVTPSVDMFVQESGSQVLSEAGFSRTIDPHAHWTHATFLLLGGDTDMPPP